MMEFSLEFRGDYFFVSTSGEAEVDDFGKLLDSIFEHGKWRAGMSYVLDHSRLDAGKMTADNVQQIAALAKRRRAKAGVAKSSIVAPRDLQFGLARMWSVYVDDDDCVSTGVFRTQQEAIAWVTDQQ